MQKGATIALDNTWVISDAKQQMPQTGMKDAVVVRKSKSG